MILHKMLIILLSLNLPPASTETTYRILKKNVLEAIKRNKELYGTPREKVSYKLWELEFGDRLAYPRGNRERLSYIASSWSRYYKCTLAEARRTNRTIGKHVTPQSVAVYEEATTRLKCGVCVSPQDTVTWSYSKLQDTLDFDLLEDKETYVQEQNGDLTIYHTERGEAGAYRCHTEGSVASPVYLEVVDDKYRLVKPSTSRGPYALPDSRSTDGKFTITSVWSEWSMCSRCGAGGRRRRYGMCYVQANQIEPFFKKTKKNTLLTEDSSNNSLKIFNGKKTKLFTGGLPCQSPLLPSKVGSMAGVRDRPNEIMIGLCKVPCIVNLTFEVRSHEGQVMERVINSAGVYSLVQDAPPLPPPPRDRLVFVRSGDRVHIKCPGTTLQDMPVSWRAGTKSIVPRSLIVESKDKMYINARDHIVIVAATRWDTNVYSCWQSGELAGIVKLEVHDSVLGYSRHFVLFCVFVLAAFVLHVSVRLLG